VWPYLLLQTGHPIALLNPNGFMAIANRKASIFAGRLDVFGPMTLVRHRTRLRALSEPKIDCTSANVVAAELQLMPFGSSLNKVPRLPRFQVQVWK
jgi:hypothetical protein